MKSKLFSRAYIKQSFDWDNFNNSVKKIVEKVDGYDFRIYDNGDFAFKCDHPLSYIRRVFKSNGFDYWWKIDRDLTSYYKNDYRFNHEDGSPNHDELEGEY